MKKITPSDQCNCRNENDCPLHGNYQTRDIIYKCITSTTVNPEKYTYEQLKETSKKNTTITKHH